MIQLAKVAAVEYAGDGIRVNCVCPGTFRSAIHGGLPAASLHQRGVGGGDVVALLSYNCPERLETIFAANYLGAIAMPINWRLRRCATSSSTPRRRRWCATGALVELASDATDGIELVRVCISPPAPAGWTPLADLGRARTRLPRSPPSPTTSTA